MKTLIIHLKRDKKWEFQESAPTEKQENSHEETQPMAIINSESEKDNSPIESPTNNDIVIADENGKTEPIDNKPQSPDNFTVT